MVGFLFGRFEFSFVLVLVVFCLVGFWFGRFAVEFVLGWCYFSCGFDLVVLGLVSFFVWYCFILQVFLFWVLCFLGQVLFGFHVTRLFEVPFVSLVGFGRWSFWIRFRSLIGVLCLVFFFGWLVWFGRFGLGCLMGLLRLF